MHNTDTRLIEAGFPCHQVGAETQRERGASSALPPLYYLHVWWARRPLTPSRAAILASLLPDNTDPEWFLCQLGIEKRVVTINGQQWTLDPKDASLGSRIKHERLEVDALVLRRLEVEEKRRKGNREMIANLIIETPSLESDVVLARWLSENSPIPPPWPGPGNALDVHKIAADPAWAKERIEWEKSHSIRSADDKYGYDRAYTQSQLATESSGLTVLDPTSGGGSIPFEALRLGHNVIANELNPVATVILHATLDFPRRYGKTLADDISRWGKRMRDEMVAQIGDLFPAATLPDRELTELREHLRDYPDLVEEFSRESLDGFLYCRQVTCPHCGGNAPLLNSCWLSKDGDEWGVEAVPNPNTKDVCFRTFPAKKKIGPDGKVVRFRAADGQSRDKFEGPAGEDPDFATVGDGDGTCIHCRQAIREDEIKRQARGESEHGKWQDRLYCVVAVRHQPKLDRDGRVQRYSTGDRTGQLKTEKITFFRPPNDLDLESLLKAKTRLQERWDAWDNAGLIPTEEIPSTSNYNRGHRLYGVNRWCDMFTPRQLLGHLMLVESLVRMTPDIFVECGRDRGIAVVAYLQFVVDKAVDYNSAYTRWIPQRCSVSGTFGQHNFSLRWTFAEMVFAGVTSGAAWCLSQVVDSYLAICKLVEKPVDAYTSSLQILNGTAAHMPSVADGDVDLICLDPPYYDNVMYAELSDFYYVWQRRSLREVFPEVFTRRLTEKNQEAIANPQRDGSREEANRAYENRMREIFSECARVLKPDGMMTMMFTHKSQEAWEALTKALMESGWTITSTLPVESEFANSRHIMDTASAASSIFVACRKRVSKNSQVSTWTGFGGTGVQQRIVKEVAESLPAFERLHLNPVDEMVASYGRALRVLSESWPVLDGDEPVSPIRAMNEASRVVAERQISRITNGRLRVDDLNPEATMALTLYGIYGLGEMPYDDVLNLSRSLNIALNSHPAGYAVEGRVVGINQDAGRQRRSTSREAETVGYHAPIIRSGSKLRLAKPEERNSRRLEQPQTEWDVLQGVIMAHRRGDTPVARAYLNQYADSRQSLVLDLLHVWAEEMPEESLRKEGQTILFGLK